MKAFSALAISLVASPAFAQAPPTASPVYSLAWVRGEGAETCPSARALSAEVERRVGRPVFEPAAERTFEVEVTRFGEKYRSDVFVRGPHGEILGRRTLKSDEPGCAALVNATALALALVIDPEAASRPPLPRSAAAFEPPPPPPPVASPPPSVPSPPPASPPPRPAAAPVPPPASRGIAELSLRGSLQLGLVPASAPGVGLAFSARPSGRWGFSVQADYSPSRNASRGAGSLDVGLTRGGALVTFEVLGSEQARWTVGAGPTVGAFHLAVRAPAPVTAAGDYWFAAAQFTTVLQVRVTNAVFIELGANGFAAIVRQQFLVRPQEEPVWSQPRIAGSLFGGVGTTFP